MAGRPLIEVACGVLRNARGEVLIAQRPAGKPAAGKWEFPGGKLEAGETASAALARELYEELGITVRRARPLIRFRHDYSDRSVVLDTQLVEAWDGEPRGLENQSLQWRRPDELQAFDVLPTVAPIAVAVRLPAHYVFTPEVLDEDALRAGLQQLPRDSLLRLRQPALDDASYAQRATRLLPRCTALGIGLMLDRDPQLVERLGAAGWHARGERWRQLDGRPVSRARWLAVSLHEGDEQAAPAPRALADFGVLGPVAATPTHPGAKPLTWPRFTGLAERLALPVYALGGVGPAQLETARASGAQGIAGIRAYWPQR